MAGVASSEAETREKADASSYCLKECFKLETGGESVPALGP